MKFECQKGCGGYVEIPAYALAEAERMGASVVLAHEDCGARPDRLYRLQVRLTRADNKDGGGEVELFSVGGSILGKSLIEVFPALEAETRDVFAKVKDMHRIIETDNETRMEEPNGSEEKGTDQEGTDQEGERADEEGDRK